MAKTLIAGTASHGDREAPWHSIADFIDGGGERGDGFVEFAIQASGRSARPGRRAAVPGPRASAWAPGDRVCEALRTLHGGGGVMICATRGLIRGPWLELALLADVHLMARDASFELPGLWSDYVPAAGGWSRLMERAGTARITAFLLASGPHQRMDARQALSWGLGDGVLTDENDSSALYQRWKDASRTATRFAMELADRNGRGGGLTPRQSRLMERASFSLLFAGDDPREGIAAFFDHKRPRFSSNT